MAQEYIPERIVQELVPGKEITIAHLIASPDSTLYEKLGLDPRTEYSKSAIGVLTISPAETAIIAADIAIKAAGIELGFVDRFSGTLIVTDDLRDRSGTPSSPVLCKGKDGIFGMRDNEDLIV